MAYFNKWITFIACCFLQAAAGLTYGFAVFAPALKDALGYSEKDVAAIGSALNFGAYLAIASGVLFDKLESHPRFGPRLIIWIGAVLVSLGYWGLYTCATIDTSPSLLQVLGFALIAGNGGTWYDTTALVTNVRNFPHHRGAVVGILKSFVGLSASMYASAYAAMACDKTAALSPPGPPAGTRTAAPTSIPSLAMAHGMGLQQQQQQQTVSSSYYDAPVSLLPSLEAVGGFMPYMQVLNTSASVVGGSQHSMPAGAASDADALAFLRVLGYAPSLLALALSVFINLVPAVHRAPDSHEGAMHSQHAGTSTGVQKQAAVSGLDEEAGSSGTRLTHGSHHTSHHHAKHQRQCMGTQARFMLVYCIVAVLAAYQLGTSLYGASHHLDTPARRTVAGTLLAVLGTLLCVPLFSGECIHWQAHAQPHAHWESGSSTSHGSRSGSVQSSVPAPFGAGIEEGLEAPLLLPMEDPTGVLFTGHQASDVQQQAASQLVLSPSLSGDSGSDSGDEGGADAVDTPMELAPFAALRTLSLWLLAVQFGLGLGSGLALVNNLGGLVLALGGRPGGQVVFVSLFSVANATGRLLGGYLSEEALHSHRATPRPTFLLAASVLMAGAQAALAFTGLGDLYTVCLLVGISFGAHWSLVPAITSDLFGLQHFGANYTMLQLAPAFGGYMLATLLTGSLVDRAAHAHGDVGHCVGADCYGNTWALLACLNVLAVLCSWGLLATTRGNYARLTAAKAHAQQHRQREQQQ